METIDNNLIELQIKEIFKNDKYIIPIYQRNYDWGDNEISQLIFDINDKIKKNEDYYIGTLIVNDKGAKSYEVIDGQQRLTTIFLMLSYFKHHIDMNEIIENFNNNLEFESRPKSTRMLSKVFEKDEEYDNKDSSIITGYNIIKGRFNKGLTQNGIEIDKNIFYNYLIKKVKLLRVVVPKGTDLNHYFEIMNTRGEQLETHEIIKAKMLSVIKENGSTNSDVERKLFNIIWEASSDMERYVQYGIRDTKLRKCIFGTYWNTFEYKNFDEILNKVCSETSHKEENKDTMSISVNNYLLVEENENDIEESSDEKENKNNRNIFEFIIKNDKLKIDVSKKEPIDKDSIRFTPVINFPNFLLQVLRVMIGDCKSNNCSKENCLSKKFKSVNINSDNIPLDDKRLIETFDILLENEFSYNLVKIFAFHLLKSRFILDKYVIKREYTSEKDDWSLKKIKVYTKSQNYISTYSVLDDNSNQTENDKDSAKEENLKLLMLLSMFHVSNPSQNYKHWLSGVLNYLYTNFEDNEINPTKYIEYLECLAERFLRERYLTDKPTGYDDIVFNQTPLENINEELLNKGTNVENFVFNYLDYKLWKDENVELNDKEKFRFSFKSSVEHFYPQTPPNNESKLKEFKLHHFGNLCLVTTERNSRYSNLLPKAKYENYKKELLNDNLISLKQRVMFDIAKENDTIWADEIIKHGCEMKKILLKFEDIDCKN